MKSIRTALEVLGMVLAFSLLARAENSPDPQIPDVKPKPGPKIQFNTPVHDFGKVSAGELVKYSFIFTNTGDQLLIITNVQPSCGCTAAADWTREVQPGAIGFIPVQFNSANFGGPVAKMVTVVCNDAAQRAIYLQIKGTVWKPVDVSPPYAVINVPPEASSGEAKVKIVNNTEGPITLGKPEVSQPGFATEIKTTLPGKEFEMTISTVPPLKPGNTQAEIRIPTSATNFPLLTVKTWANVQPALSILPPQLTLPASPFPNKVTSIITIVNNSTNPLALSEPAVDVVGAECQIREVQPGRYFTISVAFSQGYELKEGQKAELSLKSNHPKYEKIIVPIIAQAPPQPPGSPPHATTNLPAPMRKAAMPSLPSLPGKS